MSNRLFLFLALGERLGFLLRFSQAFVMNNKFGSRHVDAIAHYTEKKKKRQVQSVIQKISYSLQFTLSPSEKLVKFVVDTYLTHDHGRNESS